MEKFKLFYSLSHDPYENLALEFELLKKVKANEVFLLMYRNMPSVVFGRFQNPWREINFSMLPPDIELVRRHSGGGTVYHDLGNWNFCFIRHGKKIEETKNLSLIKDVLKKFSIDAMINERSDIVVDFDGIKKISGSAFRRVKDAVLHHGTLLVDANLSSLKGALGKEQNMIIHGKGVASHPAQVTNLVNINDKLNWDTFLLEIENHIKADFTCLDIDTVTIETKNYLKMLRSWDWKWGQGPSFDLIIENPMDLMGDIALSWHKGTITEFSSQLSGNMSKLNKEIEDHFLGLNVHQSHLDLPQEAIFKYLYKIFLSHHYF